MLIGNKLNNFIDSDKYRYIRVDIYANQGSGEPLFQMSSVRFLDKNGNLFQYPQNIVCTDNATNINENSSKMFRNTLNGKMCVKLDIARYGICDLVSTKIDIRKYNRWQWFTSNDTYYYSNRNPSKFSISFSNDGSKWIKYDEQTNYKSAPKANYTLAYTGNLKEIKMPS